MVKERALWRPWAHGESRKKGRHNLRGLAESGAPESHSNALLVVRAQLS